MFTHQHQEEVKLTKEISKRLKMLAKLPQKKSLCSAKHFFSFLK